MRQSRFEQVGDVVLIVRALRAGIAFRAHLRQWHWLGQAHLHVRDIHRKRPAGADGVPVELVVFGEEADLVRGAVTQGVADVGRHGQEIVVAGVDAHAVGEILGEPWLGPAIAFHPQHVQRHQHPIATAVAIAGGEVAIDAAPDVAAFGPHRDVLGHVEACIGADRDLDGVIQNALVGPGTCSQRQQQGHHTDAKQIHVHGSCTETAARAPVLA